MPLPKWRPMSAADLAAVVTIAEVVHVAHPEDPAVFAERLALYADGCLVLVDDAGAIVGYAVAHPWRAADPPPLDTLIGAIPDPAETFYVHDVALLPAVRGRGAARAIGERVIALARDAGLMNVSLVAVAGSAPFWRTLGFRAVDGAVPAGKLASYGADARFMVLTVAAAGPAARA